MRHDSRGERSATLKRGVRVQSQAWVACRGGTREQMVTGGARKTEIKGGWACGMGEAAMRHDQRSRTLFSQLGNWLLPLAGKLPAPPNRPFQAKITACCNNGAPLIQPAADAPGFDWQGVIP